MLQPHDRTVLWNMLRPPPGYRVDEALATTFSLDLIALLTAPLAFSLFDRLAEPTEGGNAKAPALEPTALLAAVREHAGRLTVFCQAGRITPPASYRQLLAYLEESVVSVKPRAEHGVFHPKLWVLRMSHPEAETLYRVVVATRNLTFDRSWDTALVLEGPLRPGTRGIARNRPLSEMIADLPALALQPLSTSRAESVARVADELRRVDFEVPAPFEDMVFHPLGLGRRSPDPFAELGDARLLVISPFLAAGRLDRLTSSGRGHILVSRTEELVKIAPKSLGRFESVHVLADGAEGEDEDGSDTALSAARADLGLHAKLYVADAGRETRVWTGSANASDAAFTQNVELLVELRGRKNQVGIDRLLDAETTSLRSVLTTYDVPDSPPVGETVADRLDAAVDVLRRQLSALTWTLNAEKRADLDTFDLSLTAAGVLSDEVVAATRTWPIALSPDYAQRLSPTEPRARFQSVSFAGLTAFVAFEVTVREGSEQCVQAFVVPCQLTGAPPHRLALILQTMLDDPQKVLRFLQMLLSLDPEQALADILAGDLDAASAARRGSWSATPLLEALLRALDQDPTRLEAFARTLEELGSTPEGARLIPEGIDAVWPAIRDVASEMRTAKEAS
jgi:hypothetical protein